MLDESGNFLAEEHVNFLEEIYEAASSIASIETDALLPQGIAEVIVLLRKRINENQNLGNT